ncbi:MAG: Biofilm regulatory protein A precursor [Firmicutes bacterium ADurb.Bin467]|nr:MAG: Biofilm regulatory protein A precursor [Firmicutes bacterium ADurb.Bin467]
MAAAANKRFRGMSRRKRAIISLCLVLLAAAAVFAFYEVGRWIETRNIPAPPRGDLTGVFEEQPRIEWNGRTYARKSGLTSILLMGVDKRDDAPTTGFRQGGQADFLLLLVLDRDQKTVTQLQIDRDTMTDIVVLGVLGNVTGTRRSQVCLSHGFGDGAETSCEYTVQAVKNLLFGMDVDLYAAIDLNAIGVLNDALGGVTVALEDDFSAYDPEMTPGKTLTLTGRQAEALVRYRMDVGDGTNESRMRRQRTYMEAASKALGERIARDADFVGGLYEALDGIMVTNMRKGRMVNEASRIYSYDILPAATPAGEYGIGDDGFMEFHADEAKLLQWVVETYFDPVN